MARPTSWTTPSPISSGPLKAYTNSSPRPSRAVHILTTILTSDLHCHLQTRPRITPPCSHPQNFSNAQALSLALLLPATASSAQTLCSQSTGDCKQIDTFDEGTGACTWTVTACAGLVLDPLGFVSCALESRVTIAVETESPTTEGTGTCSNSARQVYIESTAPPAIQWYRSPTGDSCSATCLANTEDANNCNAVPMNALNTVAAMGSVAIYLGYATAGTATMFNANSAELPGFKTLFSALIFNNAGTSTCGASATDAQRFCCCSSDDASCPPNPSA